MARGDSHVARTLRIRDYRLRSPRLPSPAVSEADQTYLQGDQPEGVPRLQLTGERTLPDVPEEKYWYRRHVVVALVDLLDPVWGRRRRHAAGS